MSRSISSRHASLLFVAAVSGLEFFILTADRAEAQSVPITAASVVSYSQGTLDSQDAPFTMATAATGTLDPDTGYGAPTPFNPPYSTSDIVFIGAGGSMTLQLSAPASEIGVYSNNGITDISGDYSGQAGDPAESFDYPDPPPEAIVSVSSDGTHFTTLNGGNPILFDAPTNYWADGPSFTEDFQSPGTVPANQDQPWYAPTSADYNDGMLSQFNGLNYAQMLTLLGGSAGGNWFDAGMEANYVTFTVPEDADYSMAIDALGGVPEPIVSPLFIVVSAGLMLRRRRANGFSHTI